MVSESLIYSSENVKNQMFKALKINMVFVKMHIGLSKWGKNRVL
jgi:sensor domain CHASE-containing protein